MVHNIIRHSKRKRQSVVPRMELRNRLLPRSISTAFLYLPQHIYYCPFLIVTCLCSTTFPVYVCLLSKLSYCLISQGRRVPYFALRGIVLLMAKVSTSFRVRTLLDSCVVRCQSDNRITERLFLKG